MYYFSSFYGKEHWVHKSETLRDAATPCSNAKIENPIAWLLKWRPLKTVVPAKRMPRAARHCVSLLHLMSLYHSVDLWWSKRLEGPWQLPCRNAHPCSDTLGAIIETALDNLISSSSKCELLNKSHSMLVNLFPERTLRPSSHTCGIKRPSFQGDAVKVQAWVLI